MLAPALIEHQVPAAAPADDLRCQAHDLRNQLTVMVGYCDLLSPTLARPGDAICTRALDMVGRIRAAAENSNRIVARMMAPTAAAIAELDLHTFLVEEVGAMGLRLLKEDINVALERGVRVPTVRVDPLGLQRAVVNLAQNARDAILAQSVRLGSGRITFATSLPAVAGARPYAVLAVHDNGPGMTRATLARIWEPGWSTKADAGGTRGYGLASVRAFVESAGGEVDVHSEPGRGTTFTLLLPAA